MEFQAKCLDICKCIIKTFKDKNTPAAKEAVVRNLQVWNAIPADTDPDEVLQDPTFIEMQDPLDIELPLE